MKIVRWNEERPKRLQENQEDILSDRFAPEYLLDKATIRPASSRLSEGVGGGFRFAYQCISNSKIILGIVAAVLIFRCIFAVLVRFCPMKPPAVRPFLHMLAQGIVLVMLALPASTHACECWRSAGTDHVAEIACECLFPGQMQVDCCCTCSGPCNVPSHERPVLVSEGANPRESVEAMRLALVYRSWGKGWNIPVSPMMLTEVDEGNCLHSLERCVSLSRFLL